MTTKILALAGATLIAGLLGPSAAFAASAPEPAKPVDVARFYTGVRHEIGRRPMSLTDGCVAGATEYTPHGQTDITVRDTCRSGAPDGPEKAIGGPGRIQDAGTNAKLHVSYRFMGFIPVGRDYWVLDHDEAYSWFISADPSFHDLWIYTRDPRPSDDERRRLTERAKALGYDTTQLEFPAQP